jgi:hydroxymethylglutaryl-CoA lyase
MKLPKRVILTEVGMRDGFQFEQKPIPLALKLEVLRGLVEAGVRRIQATSFVHPQWVPQMADAEELCRQLPENDALTITGLALNPRGVERAARAGLKQVDLSISTNDRHSRDNANRSREEALASAFEMVKLARTHGMQAQMGFQCVFGYREPGDTPIERITGMAERFLSLGIESLSLADSTGMANPILIREVLDAVMPLAGDTPLVLHLHDTRGLGVAHICAALEAGGNYFDASLGGLGGCPFIPGATGNIATEDTLYLMESMGVETGIDRFKVAAVTRKVAAFLERELPGKLYRLESAS